MLVGRCLYLKPGDTLPDGSKEAFVALLQYAEEVLKCSHIYACFKRSAAVRGGYLYIYVYIIVSHDI